MSVQTTIDRLAARALLLVISRGEHPELTGRLLDFMQDRGAVGMLLASYRDGDSIEAVALTYWRSRLEPSAARLEDLVTTMLMSIASSLIAGILVEFWKGEPGFLRTLFQKTDEPYVEEVAASRGRAESDLQGLLKLYLSKGRENGVSDETMARNLYEAVRGGMPIASAIDAWGQELPTGAEFRPLRYLPDAARGLLLTEVERSSIAYPRGFQQRINGLPLCDRFGFGEIVPLSHLPGDSGAPLADVLNNIISTTRLHPTAWPRDSSFVDVSPKILLLYDELFNALRSEGLDSVLGDVAGVISRDGGMTSHVAVMCRGFQVGAVGYPYSADEVAGAKFALIYDGTLTLFWNRPNITVKEFDYLLSNMAHRRRWTQEMFRGQH